MAEHPIVELKVGDTWTDITSYVYYRDGITITRGRSGEGSQMETSRCSFTLNNRDGRFSPRNPHGPYYGQIGRNTPIRVSVDGGLAYLNCTGGTGGRVSTPDTSALDITGDIDVRAEVFLRDWNVPDNTEIVGKYLTTGNQRSWRLYLSTGGYPTLGWSSDGTNVTTATSTTALATNGRSRMAIRATLDVDNGASGKTVTFYTADSIDGPWTQLGSAVTTASTTSIYSSSAPLEIGDISTSTLTPVTGRIYAAQVFNGINGTAVADVDFTAQTVGDTSFTGDDGLTWTVSSPASLSNRHLRFTGEVSDWAVDWDISGKDVVTKIEAAGIIRRLTQSASPLRSPMFRDFTNPQRTGIVAYWPLEDEAGASSFASGITGHPVMKYTGRPTLSSSSVWAGSANLPVMNDGTFTAVVPPYTYTGEIAFRFLCNIPEAGVVAETLLFSLNTTGTCKRWEVVLATSGALRVTAYDTNKNELLGASFIGFTPNGELINLTLELVQDGSDVDYRLLYANYTDTELITGGIPQTAISGTLASYTLGSVSRITIGDAGLSDTSIGHISLANDRSAYTATGAAILGWRGENPTNRLRRLVATEQGIPLQVHTRAQTGNPVTLGTQTQKDFVDLVREIGDTDLGILYEPRDDIGFAYRSRLSLYNQPARLTLDYSAHGLAAPLLPSDDDRYTRNDITVTREGGSFYRAVLEEGTLSVQSPPDGVGRYDENVTLSLGTDAQTADQAGWRLHTGTVDEARYPQVSLNLRHATFTGDASKMDDALRLDIGDRIVITNPPDWLPPDDIELLAVGFQETLGIRERDIVVNCIPASPYNVAFADAPRYARADASTSVLAGALTTSQPTANVKSFDGPLWVTAAPSLITNYELATDLTDWFGNGCTLERVPAPADAPFDSAWVMKLTPDGVAQYPNAGHDLVPVTEGRTYTASGWQMGATDLNAGLNINWFDSGGNYLSTSANGQTMTAGEWTWFEASATAPAGAVYANIAPTVSTYPPSTDILYSSVLTLRPTMPGETPFDFPVNVRCNGEIMRVTACTDAVHDTFTRTVASGWGTADIGGAWTIRAGTASEHSTSGTYAVHTNPSPGFAHITTVASPGADVDLLCDIAVSATATGASILGGPVARCVDNNNHYMARLEFTTGGAINLTLRKRVSGSETQLAALSSVLSYTATTFYRVRFQIAGSTLRAKVWAASGTEPRSWQVTTTDTDITAANNVGIRSFTNTSNSNTNPEVRVDNFRIVNPQTFTADRSVNEVVKTHDLGTDVRLAHPTYVSI
ncbi:hypothetical protein ACPCIZ_12925 [Streptomyces cellulosae]